MTHECNRCKELSTIVDEILEKLVELTKDQHTAFREKDHPAFTRLDKELELVVGQKERSIGAFREHKREHGTAELIGKAS